MHVSSIEKAENTKGDFVFNLFIWKNSRNHGKWFYLGFKYPLKVGGLVQWAFFFFRSTKLLIAYMYRRRFTPVLTSFVH